MIHKSLSPHQSRAVILWIGHCTWDCNWWRLDRAEPSQPSNKEALGRRLRDDFNNMNLRRRTPAANERRGSLGPCTEWHGTRQTPCCGNTKHPLPSTPETKQCQLRALMLRRRGSQNQSCQPSRRLDEPPHTYGHSNYLCQILIWCINTRKMCVSVCACARVCV